MEIRFQMNYVMPKEVIQAFHITEDTAFETYFEDGVLYIRALPEEEKAKAAATAPQFEYCDDEDETDEELTGDDLPEESDDDMDCHPEDCEDCEYFCHHCGKCVIDG